MPRVRSSTRLLSLELLPESIALIVYIIFADAVFVSVLWSEPTLNALYMPFIFQPVP